VKEHLYVAGRHFSTAILVLRSVYVTVWTKRSNDALIMIVETYTALFKTLIYSFGSVCYIVFVLIVKIYFQMQPLPPNERKGAHLKFMIKSTSLAQTLFFSVNLVYETVNRLCRYCKVTVITEDNWPSKNIIL